MESLRENKLFDIRLIGAARSGAGSLFSTHEKSALLSSRFGIHLFMCGFRVISGQRSFWLRP
jgi:hypothetical protein